MSNKVVTVVKKANEREAKIVTVEDTLSTWQGIVGGYIETIGLTDDILIILNEEGKLMDLKPNFVLPCYDGGYETIVGDVAFIGYNDEGDFVSLNDDQLEFLTKIGLFGEDN